MSNKTVIRQAINRILAKPEPPAPVPSIKPAPAPEPPKYQDKTIECPGCGKSFVWSAGDQLYFSKRGLENTPKWCTECKKKRRQYFNNHPNQGQK